MNKTYNGNVFNKFTRQSLRANRTRTLVTIIGIVLSMALLTAVIEGAYSGVGYVRRVIQETEGPWMGMVSGLDGDSYDKAEAISSIKESAGWLQIGWAEAENRNEYKPYLLIKSITSNFSDLAAVKLRDGRMPEKAGEIIIPRHYFTNGGTNYETGEEIKLDVGVRCETEQGIEMTEMTSFDIEIEEAIVNTQPRTYTVVGIYDRLDGTLENFSCPGYVALTVDDTPVEAAESQDANGQNAKAGTDGEDSLFSWQLGSKNGTYSILFTTRNVLNIDKIIEEIGSYTDNNVTMQTHSDLLNTYGMISNIGVFETLISLVVILVVLIIFGSVTLIYNSFSISVSERTKQFGILKSVGATKKQIRHTVFYEAFLLALIGIVIGAVVGCAGIGITLSSLSGSFGKLFPESGSVKMRLELNVWALAIAAVLCLITVLISAWIPARRAIRISAIEAIRQSMDIKVTSRQVRTSALTRKLFGFEGMMASKNFKRNRKRVRSVIVSLFLSLILFITASSFTSYLKTSVDAYSSSDQGYDILVNYYLDADYDELQNEFSALPGVDSVVYSVANYTDVFIDNKYMEDKDRTSSFVITGNDKITCVQASLNLVSDSAFRTLLKEHGISEDGYFDHSAPRALAYVKDTISVYQEQTNRYKFQEVNVIKSGVDSFTAEMYNSPTSVEIDGETYVFSRVDVDENGTPHAHYSHLISHTQREDYQGVGVDSEDYELPADEYTHKVDIEVGAVLDGTAEYYLRRGGLILIYPYSMADVLLEGSDFVGNIYPNFYVKAPNHSAVNESILNLLEEKGEGSGYYNTYDFAENKETERLMVTVINVFAYGFIILISLIAVANVFNTISTNISLRRREFAMLKSIGLGNKGFYKMMNYECIIYGLRGLMWGLPVSILLTYLIFRAVGASVDMNFYIPWHSIVIAVCSVFIVVFAAMWYSASKIRKDNPIDALKNENI